MSIPIVCPICNASYQVDDELRGQRILCRKCDKRINVDEAEAKVESDARPARRRGRDNDDENQDDRALLDADRDCNEYDEPSRRKEKPRTTPGKNKQVA